MSISFSSHSRINLLAFLILLLLSFGLLIPWLGFYWDDWPIVLASRLQGVGAFWDYYRLERPFSAWTYILTIPFLGTQPLTWHIFTLLLRWLSVAGMWWCFKLLWPERARQAVWAALLFAVYPVFTDQPVALAFSQHWICYGLYFLSLGLMLYSARTGRNRLLLNAIALAATAVHMLTMEYMWGLELLRPLMLWFVFGASCPDWSARLRQVLKLWLPYLLVFALVLGWRLAFAGELVQGNSPQLLSALLASPLTTVIQLVQVSLQDMVNNLVGAWYQTMNPADLDLFDSTVLASLGVAAVTAGLTWLYLRRMGGDSSVAAFPQNDTPADVILSDNPQGWSAKGLDSSAAALPQDDILWVRQALLLGLLGALLGPLPVWLIERQALVGLHSGRFALAGMFGLSILIVAALEWFTPRRLPKIALLAVLVGLASGYHLRNSVSYYRSTLRQNDFYWQLYWRAPYIQPNTAILSADELFPYVGRNPTAVTLNLLYPQSYGIRQVGYWFLELFHDVGPAVVPRLERGRTFTPEFRTFNFNGSSLDGLVIYYKPGAGRCLWVLAPEDVDNPELPEITRQALPVSNLSRIQPEPVPGDYPPTDLFGDEPDHTWCYYYQKAELARQLGDWQGVLRLEEQAAQAGFEPGNANERLVFIEAFARTGRWQIALQQSADVFTVDDALAPRLCRLWERIANAMTIPEEERSSLESLRSELQCQPAQ